MKPFLLLGPVRHAIVFAANSVEALAAAPEYLCLHSTYDLAEPSNQQLLADQSPACYAGCFGLAKPLPEIEPVFTRCLAVTVDLIIPDGFVRAETYLNDLLNQSVVLDYKVQSQGFINLNLAAYQKGILV